MFMRLPATPLDMYLWTQSTSVAGVGTNQMPVHVHKIQRKAAASESERQTPGHAAAQKRKLAAKADARAAKKQKDSFKF